MSSYFQRTVNIHKQNIDTHSIKKYVYEHFVSHIPLRFPKIFDEKNAN